MADLRLPVTTISFASPKPKFLRLAFLSQSLESVQVRRPGTAPPCGQSPAVVLSKEHEMSPLHPARRSAVCGGVLLFLSSLVLPASSPRAQNVNASACLPAAAESQLQ